MGLNVCRVKNMKNKVLILGVLLLIIVAFSGIASAATVSNKGTKTSYSGDTKIVDSWYVVKYSNKHIVLVYREKQYYYDDYLGGYYLASSGTVKASYKLKSKKIYVNKYLSVNYYNYAGSYYDHRSGHWKYMQEKTKYKTALSYFKHHKNRELNFAKQTVE